MTTPAGRYPDPEQAQTQRYWDGQAWTEHRATAQRQHVPMSASNLMLAIAGGILMAVIAVWLVVSML